MDRAPPARVAAGGVCRGDGSFSWAPCRAGAVSAARSTLVGGVFVLLQVLTPIHQAVGANLGDRTAAWLYDRLTEACVRPPGMGHLEDPKLTSDLAVARDFDLGMTGPPLYISMDFIAGRHGRDDRGCGFGNCPVRVRVVGAARARRRVALDALAAQRERHLARSQHRGGTRGAARCRLRLSARRRSAAGQGAAFVRSRRLDDRPLHWPSYPAPRSSSTQATRLRERPVLWSLLIVGGANVLVFWSLATAASAGRVNLAEVVVFAQTAVGTSMIAFGGLSWAMDGAAAPVAAVLRLEPAMSPAGALASGRRPAAGMPAREIRFRGLTFAYPGGSPVLDEFDLTIPAGSSIAIVGQNGAGKTTLAKLLCRLYDPQFGAIEVDGIDVRELSLESWRERITAVFQDFIRFELPLRDNVAPAGAPDEMVRAALDAAGASKLARLDTVLARGYEDGTDLSGGQWQRIALARALCAVRVGAGVVLLDEPTAQLDVRGEAEIFNRILAATRHCTTILISHRFSTVRQADRICVLEHGRASSSARMTS